MITKAEALTFAKLKVSKPERSCTESHCYWRVKHPYNPYRTIDGYVVRFFDTYKDAVYEYERQVLIVMLAKLGFDPGHILWKATITMSDARFRTFRRRLVECTR